MNVKRVALLRLEYPNMSLVELGKKLKNPIGKSGINYRLKKLWRLLVFLKSNIYMLVIFV